MEKIGRALLAVTQWTIGGIFVLVGFFGIMWFFGSAVETIGTEITNIERCQKRAATPYEYHRCR